MEQLQAYAAHSDRSEGRLYTEAPCPTRTVYQRDRDRIVHSNAFRRLIHKTQVFIYHEGDHYRTRLTHSLEVAQIARTLARALRLNEDLTEAIALAHDLGHTPFGHAGEDALNAAMQDAGGFDHNAQSLKVVTALERRYASFRGLNLTFETLEGMVKHNGPLMRRDGQPAPRYAVNGAPQAIRAYNEVHDLGLDTYPSLEAQIAALADDIAYNNHDIDDGFRAGYIDVTALEEQVPMAGHAIALVRTRHGGLPDAMLVYEMNRRMIASMVEDVLAETRARVDCASPRTVDEVRAQTQPLAHFSEKMAANIAELRAFLFANVYRHPAVVQKVERAASALTGLYRHYLAHPEVLPAEVQDDMAKTDGIGKARIAGDFVAGMTDRFALQTHAALFGNLPHT